jgi:hypothetical protein
MRWLLLLLALAACNNDAVGVAQTNNNNVVVELLFENDGCRVYRFSDAGYNRYYADCGPVTSSRTVYYQCGKSRCSRQEPDAIDNPRPKR